MKKCYLLLAFLFFLTLQTINSNSFAQFRDINYQDCQIKRQMVTLVLKNVKKGNKNAISSLAGCLRHSHKLIFHACLIDPSQLRWAENKFRDSESFVKRLMKIHPEILQYASNRIRNDVDFLQRATYINRNALKYAGSKLRDNKFFMRKMIKRDSHNYIYASDRLKSFHALSKIAFQDNGSLIMYAPEKIRNNKKLAKIAIKSNLEAHNFIGPDLKKDKSIKLLAKNKKTKFSKEKLEKFLQKEYFDHDKNRLLNKESNQENFIINRNYITKWHRNYRLRGHNLKEEWHLTTAPNRNYPNYWQKDLEKYPKLIKKIEKFFKNRYLDQGTIDSLSLTYLAEVQKNPLTLVFNLYLLRNSNDFELKDKYVAITSLTAIAHKTSSGWRLSVINVNFDTEEKTDILYRHGLKRYLLQTIYFQNKDNKNPKVIFKVEDKLNTYFEVFGQTSTGKYRLLYRLDPQKHQEKKEWQKPLPEIKTPLSREEEEEEEWRKIMKKQKHQSNNKRQ